MTPVFQFANAHPIVFGIVAFPIACTLCAVLIMTVTWLFDD